MRLSTSPPIIAYSRISRLKMCSIILSLRDWILFHRCRLFFILFSASSFFTIPVQVIFSIFLKYLIAKASGLFFRSSWLPRFRSQRYGPYMYIYAFLPYRQTDTISSKYVALISESSFHQLYCFPSMWTVCVLVLFVRCLCLCWVQED